MSWTSVVPQIFYDGIARLAAGYGVILTTALIWHRQLGLAGTTIVETIKAAPLTAAFGLSIVFYLVALVLEGLRHLPKTVRKSHNAHTKQTKEPSGEDTKAKKRTPEFFRLSIWNTCLEGLNTACDRQHNLSKPSDPIAIDAVRIACPEAGARLVKLRAEISLCQTATFGWAAASFVSLIAMTVLHPFNEISYLSKSAILICIVASIGVWSLRRHLLRYYYLSLYNHWLLLVQPKLNVRSNACSASTADNNLLNQITQRGA